MTSVSVVLLLVCCVSACGLLVSRPIFASLDHSFRRDRVAAIDGLRGVLALSVVVHHGLIYRRYLSDGGWFPVRGPTELLGSGGVAMFFLVTGYLFWGKIIAQRGRIAWGGLFIGRVFRIGPMFLLAAALALLATFALRPSIVVEPDLLARQIAPYLMLGVAPIGPVNDYPTPMLLVQAVWTLRYEWAFYAVLPLIAVAARWRTGHLLAPLLLLGAGLLFFPGTNLEDGSQQAAAATILFSLGALAASLQATGLIRRGTGHAGSVLCVLILAAVLTNCPTAYGRPALLGLGAAFWLIAFGSDLFGLLRSRILRRLGEISYGVYLLQGLALAGIMRPEPIRSWVVASQGAHLAVVVGAAMALVCMAAAAHVLVERPGIAMGRRVAAAIAARRSFLELGEDRVAQR